MQAKYIEKNSIPRDYRRNRGMWRCHVAHALATLDSVNMDNDMLVDDNNLIAGIIGFTSIIHMQLSFASPNGPMENVEANLL